MIQWVRIDREIGDSADVGLIAAALRVRVAEVVGCLTCLYGKMAKHAQDGRIGHLPDETLEQWALWRGRPGAFAPLVRQHFVDASGVVILWEEYNGAAIRKAEADAERQRRHRDRKRDVTRDSTRTVGVTSRVDEDVDGDGTTTASATTPPATPIELAAAANRGITERWGEQTRPIRASAGSSHTFAEKLAQAGVPGDFACDALFTIAQERPAENPASSLSYFTAAVLERWEGERERRAGAGQRIPTRLPDRPRRPRPGERQTPQTFDYSTDASTEAPQWQD